MVPWPPYKAVVSQVDFFLFLKLTVRVKGCQFELVKEIQERTMEQLNRTCMECWEIWKHVWNHCVNAEGDYCEGIMN